MDLTNSEGAPTPKGIVRVSRTREASILRVEVRFWRPHLVLNYHVQGSLSWAAPLCAVVLLLSIVAAIAVPHAVLSPDAPAQLRALVAGISGGSILMTGTYVLLYLLKKRSRR